MSKRAQYFKINGLEVSNGNTKIGNDTLILNMGSGTHCPSRQLGMCKLGNKCYALKAERMYPTVLPMRDRQETYWLNTRANQIIRDFDALLTKHKALAKRVRYLRFNEAGDFPSQNSVDKLDRIASYLRLHHNIITYGYSARSDLDFSDVEFFCKGSGHNRGNHGMTIALPKDQLQSPSGLGLLKVKNIKGVFFQICPGSCKTCSLCKVQGPHNIVFPLH